jgi:hypothetical protein
MGRVVALVASLCFAGTHARISFHSRSDIPDIVTSDGLLAFSKALSSAMTERESAKAKKSECRGMLGRRGYPSDAERRFPAAMVAYGNLHMGLQTALESEHFVKRHVLSPADRPMLWLEFGVYRGSSINATRVFADELVARLGRTSILKVVGFDTFEGLPEVWAGHSPKGAFSWRDNPKNVDHSLSPPTRPGISFEIGLFSDTLGPFLARNAGLVAFVNVDNDLYGGAKQVLDDLAPRFFDGTMIHFHEIGDMKHVGAAASRAATPASVQEECRALFEWLVARPCAHLHLVEMAAQPRHAAAVFVVHFAKGCTAV